MLIQRKRSWLRVVRAVFFVVLLGVFCADINELWKAQTANEIVYHLMTSEQDDMVKAAINHIPYDFEDINHQIAKADIDARRSQLIGSFLVTLMFFLVIVVTLIQNFIKAADKVRVPD